ncbi:MAG: type II secretion system F family protein [Patescibacteria group bacterium]
MPNYLYKIINKKGEIKSGRISSESKEQVADQIKEDGWYIIEIKDEKKSLLGLSFLAKKINLDAFERINFTDHLAALIKAGAPLGETLEAYVDDGDKRLVIIDSIIKDIRQGKKLSESMAVYPKTFSSLYISLIQAGELTGSLDETLEYLTNELRREYEFKQRIKSALFYPALVLFVALVVILIIILGVIPKIAEVTKSLGGDMPLATKIVTSAAFFLTHYGILISGLIISGIVFLIFLLRIEKTREKIGAYLLKLPMVGKIMKKYILARLLRIIGSCTRYGVILTAALDAGSEVVDNIRYKEACLNINKKIIKGISLSSALSGEGVDLFPGLIVRTIKGAEKTGGLDAALLRLSTQYEIEVDRDLKRLTDLIEPILVVFLGIIVLAIAVSVIGPIYQMTSKIK